MRVRSSPGTARVLELEHIFAILAIPDYEMGFTTGNIVFLEKILFLRDLVLDPSKVLFSAFCL